MISEKGPGGVWGSVRPVPDDLGKIRGGIKNTRRNHQHGRIRVWTLARWEARSKDSRGELPGPGHQRPSPRRGG